jgi:hypothetical protein
MSGKPKVIKDYDKLDESIQDRIRENYPDGFDKHLVKFTNAEGKSVSALPFETEDRYYLVRMTLKEARQLDDDFDADAALSEEIKGEFEEKYDSGESDDEDDDYNDKDDSEVDEEDDEDDY